MNVNQLANFDDESGELDLASPGGPEAAAGPTGFAGELTGATGSGRAINTTAVVLGIIVAAAAVGIVSMRWVNAASAKPRPGAVPTEDLIANLSSLLPPPPSDDAAPSPLVVMRDDPNELQVPFSDVQKNPFFIPDVDKIVETVEAVTVTTRSPEELRQERRQMIESAATRISVSSMLTGSSPVAILDDRAVRIGDVVVVEDWEFTVESIDSIGVTVVYEDEFLREPVRVIRGIETGEPSRPARRPGGRPRR